MVGARSAGGTSRERRRAAIAACCALLSERGAGGVSTRSVCARAGLSPEALKRQFPTIADLIIASYSDVADRVSAARAAAVAQAGEDPRARLSAYVASTFGSPISDPDLFFTWLAFWPMTRTNPTIARIHSEIYASTRAEIETLLTACDIIKARRRRAAIAISAMVGGMWIKLVMDPAAFTAVEARSIVDRLIELIVEE